jgi:DNA mismatch repair protein MutS
VARLAGLPDSVVARARVVLDALEKGEREGGVKKQTIIDDLPLFSVAVAAPTPPATKGPSPVEERLKALHPDEMTPKDAIAALYELRSLLAE